MGQITIFTKEDDPHCQAVRLDLKECHLPFQEIVLDPTERQKVPEIFFDNHPVEGGINELLTILQKWEVVEGPDGQPRLQPIQSSGSRHGDQGSYHQDDYSRGGRDRGGYHNQHYHDQHDPYHDNQHQQYQDTPSDPYNRRRNHDHHPGNYPDQHYHPNNDPYHDNNHNHHRNSRDIPHHTDPYRRHNQNSYNNNYHHDRHQPQQSRSFHSGTTRDPHPPQQQPQQQDDFHRRLHFRDHRRQRQQENANFSLDRRNAFRNNHRDNAYQRHSFHGRELRRELEEEMYHQEQRNHTSFNHHNLYQDIDNSSSHHHDYYPQPEGNERSVATSGGYNPRGPRRPNSFGTESTTTSASQHSNNSQDISNHGNISNHGKNISNHGNNNTSSHGINMSSLRGGSASNRRRAFQQRGNYQRHSFHGKELMQREQQQQRKDRYQDDDAPFVRRDSLGKESLVSEHAQQDQPCSDTSSSNHNHSNRRGSNNSTSSSHHRRDHFRNGNSIKKSYERHSFHGRELRQRHHNQQLQQSLHDDSTSSSRRRHMNDDSSSRRRGDYEPSKPRRTASRDKNTLFRQESAASFHHDGGGNSNHQKIEYDDDPTFAEDEDNIYNDNPIHDDSDPTESSYSNQPGSSAGDPDESSGSRFQGSSRSLMSSHRSLSNKSLNFSGKSLNLSNRSLSNRSLLLEEDEDEIDESERTPTMGMIHQYGVNKSKRDLNSSRELNSSKSSIMSSMHESSHGNLSGSNASLGASLTADDLEFHEASEHGSESNDTAASSVSSNKPKPTAVFPIGGNPMSAQLNRSFRRNSNKSLNAKMYGAKRAASMRYLGSKTSLDSNNDSSAQRQEVTRSRSAHLRSSTGSPIPEERRSVSPVPTARSSARTQGLRKSARTLSDRRLMSMMGTKGDDSSSSLWSSSTGMKEDKRMVELPAGRHMSVLEATRELQRIIPRDSLKYNLTTYRNSFTGSTAADAFQEAYGLSREEAQALGNSLHHAKLLHHVCNDHGYGDTSKLFFRLQCHQTPEVLNSFCVWRDETTLTKHGEEVMLAVMAKLQPLMATITDEVKGRVHYSRATKHHEDLVAELDFAICELQMVKLARMDKKSLLAFGLNVYQLFLHYAFIKVGIPGSTSAFTSFWTSLKFDVGGNLYTFSEWWNGICRGNRKGPHGPKPFQGKDSRMFLNLPDRVDPRIHFAAGMTHFMRPMFVYSGAQVDLELEHVARIYCKNVEFVWMEISSNTLTLAPYFQTYMSDFASTKYGIPKILMSFMSGKEKAHIDEMLTVARKIKVEFHENTKNDGWSEYAGEHFVYKSSPKADTKALVKKKSDAPKREVKRSGSLKALFRLEGAAAS